MKVVLIYRKPRIGSHSIEELFHSIAKELRKQTEVEEYKVGYRSQLLSDVLALRRLNADIYHVTGDVHYFIPFLPSRKTVLTVHDINYYLHNLKGIKRWIYKWLWLKLPLRTAGVVTAISDETRNILVENFDQLNEDIHVINNCYRDTLRPSPKSFNADCPIILNIGTRPHKNVPRLIEALEGINCRLVLIGRLEDDLKQKLVKYNIQYETTADLSDEDLYKHYVDCDICFIRLFAEGFGMPIIEGQVVGRPVVTSNIAPMSGVVGEGGCLSDPNNVQDIRNNVQKIIIDETYRTQLVKKGFENIKRFSPATISMKYLYIYNTLHEKRV